MFVLLNLNVSAWREACETGNIAYINWTNHNMLLHADTELTY